MFNCFKITAIYRNTFILFTFIWCLPIISGQFKIIDSTSFRMGHQTNIGGGDNNYQQYQKKNVSLVKINTITTTPDIVLTEKPRGFSVVESSSIITTEDINTITTASTMTTMEDIDTTTVSELPKTIKVHIETTSETPIFRIGKLQERPQRINNALQERPKFPRSINTRPIIEIQQIRPNPYTGTVPTPKRPIEHPNLLDFNQSIADKLILKANKYNYRKYKSKCRCEKISNCPKIQISVPRCPRDYFMCCF